MTPDDMYRFFGMIVPIKQDQNIIATGIEKFSQFHGDYLKKIIGEKDSNLGPIMVKHLDEEFTKKYPQRKGLYI
jgi:hypothetical protein